MFKKYFCNFTDSLMCTARIVAYTISFVTISIIGIPAAWLFILIAPVIMVLMSPIILLIGFYSIESESSITETQQQRNNKISVEKIVQKKLPIEVVIYKNKKDKELVYTFLEKSKQSTDYFYQQNSNHRIIHGSFHRA